MRGGERGIDKMKREALRGMEKTSAERRREAREGPARVAARAGKSVMS